MGAAFEMSFKEAQEIIMSMKGYIDHEIQKCMEEEDKYLLIVRWEALNDHVDGFRKHKDYAKWKSLLHHFYDPFPQVEHYERIY